MSDSQTYLNTLFADVFRQLEPKRPPPPIEVRFYPYVDLDHTLRWRAGRIYVRLSDLFRDAPPHVQRALAFILVAKHLRRRTPQMHERVYRDYATAPHVLRAAELARRQRGRKLISSARGSVHNLDRLFARLNRRYFDDELAKPTLTWSARRTRRILGHHDPVHETIVISKTLDAADVPEWFVEYILFHEMLHIKHPARLVNGRRLYHTKAFRAEEARYPRYAEAQDWLDNIARERRAPRARAA
ncbi:MAG TPA: SprT-like domain-containing protein [Pyrinomonadaceae bacterium]|nr:SprT-like domain-containing protein [Pyrinomonadaceae bacterium]